jgi:hypothetical protein
MQKAVVKKHRESLGREMSLQLATSPRAENREKAPCGAMFLKPIAVGQTVTPPHSRRTREGATPRNRR